MSLTLTKEVLNKYLNPVFVETGTYLGGGVELALSCGFLEVHSIELSEHYYEICRKKFSSRECVHIYPTDSINIGAIMAPINHQCTIWLDGHTIPGNSLTATSDSPTPHCPAIDELRAIATHPIKTHTILIDDMDAFDTPILDSITVADLKRELLLINPLYNFKYENGKVQNDILVAYL